MSMGVYVCPCVRVGLSIMDSQTAECILMEFCKHDSCVPAKFFHNKNSLKMLPLVGEKGIKMVHTPPPPKKKRKKKRKKEKRA